MSTPLLNELSLKSTKNLIFPKSNGQFSVHNNLLKISAAYDIAYYSLLEILSSLTSSFWDTTLSWFSSYHTDHRPIQFPLLNAPYLLNSKHWSVPKFPILKFLLFFTYIYFPDDLINSYSFRSSIHWWLPNMYLQSRPPCAPQNISPTFYSTTNRHLKIQHSPNWTPDLFPQTCSSQSSPWHLHFSSCSCKNPRDILTPLFLPHSMSNRQETLLLLLSIPWSKPFSFLTYYHNRFLTGLLLLPLHLPPYSMVYSPHNNHRDPSEI